MEEKDWKVAMEISEDQSSSGYAHINVRFVKYCYGDTDYFHSYDSGIGGFELNNLWITCQMDDHNPGTYADRISYNATCIELSIAERMVKTLKHIHKGLDKYERKFGYCEGFADFVIRIAGVLNVEHFVFRKYGCPNQYEFEPKHAKYKIQRMIMDNVNRLQGKGE